MFAAGLSYLIEFLHKAITQHSLESSLLGISLLSKALQLQPFPVIPCWETVSDEALQYGHCLLLTWLSLTVSHACLTLADCLYPQIWTPPLASSDWVIHPPPQSADITDTLHSAPPGQTICLLWKYLILKIIHIENISYWKCFMMIIFYNENISYWKYFKMIIFIL